MARFGLTDFEWSVIQPLLPQKSRGVKRVDDRRVLNGIFWRFRTWRALGGYSGALRAYCHLRLIHATTPSRVQPCKKYCPYPQYA